MRGDGMYLPKVYENFVKDYPDVFDAYEKLGIACRNAGPLDEKAQNLVKLGLAIGVKLEGRRDVQHAQGTGGRGQP